MAKIKNSSIWGGEDSKGKPIELAKEPKYTIGQPMKIWIWAVYPTLIIPSFLMGFFTAKSCYEPAPSDLSSSTKVEETAPHQNQGITLTNIEELFNVNPASPPPPSSEVEVIKKERRIYVIPPRQ